MAVLKSAKGDKNSRRQDTVLDPIISDEEVSQITCTRAVK